MEASLEEKIKKLWEKRATHLFFTEISRLIKEYSLRDIVLEAAKVTSSRTYQKPTNRMFPNSLIGLEEAWQLAPFFYTRNKLLPIVQMLWYGVGQAQHPEVDIQEIIGVPPSSSELNLETFKRIYLEKNFKKAFSLMIFLLRDDRLHNAVLSFLIDRHLSSEANEGEKVIHLIKTWQFCETMKWENYAFFWFPVMYDAFHHLPSTQELFSSVEKVLHKIENISFLSKKEHSESEYHALKESIWNDEKMQTIEKIIQRLKEGNSLNSLFEGLKLIASELVYQSSSDHWFSCTQVNFYTKGLCDVLPILSSKTQLKALLMAGLMIKKAAILAKPFSEPSLVSLKTIDEKKNAQFFLEYGIERGNSGQALGALDHLIAEKKIDQNPVIFDLLAFLASKNTYSVFYGHDIQLALTCLKNYKISHHPLKQKYLFALVKFLASQPKEHTIYNALKNTQKIRLGYYSTGGEFSF